MAETIPIKDDKDYYIEAIRRNMRQSIDRHSILKSQMSRCYDYFHGTQGNTNGFMDLFDVYDVRTKDVELKTPVVYMNLNKIKAKVNVLIGDLIDLGFEASATAVNREAKTRKQEFKLKVLADMSTKPMMDTLAAESGIEIASEIDDVDDPQEFLKNYKDVSELCIEACLRYTLEYWKYQYKRLTMLIDVIVSGECHASTFIQNGMPGMDRENPMNVFYPRNVNDDDFLSKTQSKGIVYYGDVREVTEKYKTLPKEAIEEMKHRLKTGASSTETEFYITYNNTKFFEPYDTGQNRVLVSSWQWVEIEKVAGVQAVYENGLETFEILTGEEAKQKVDKRKYKDAKEFKVVRKEINVLKQGTLIADKYLVDYGDAPNQPRFYTNYSKCVTSVTSYRPFYLNGQSTSLVMDIMQPQDFVNYLWTKIQLEITKSNGTVIEVDTSKLPKEWGSSQQAINTMFHYMKAHGVKFYNSQQGDQPGQGGSAAKVNDTGISSAIVQFMNLLAFMDNEMKTISGISDARAGVIEGANQLNGVTQMAIHQSAKTTKYLLQNFLLFESDLLTKHARNIRLSWKNNPERWRDIIGDYYTKFLEIDDDIADDEHEIRVKNGTMSRQTLKEYIVAGLQHNLPMHEALELEMQADEDIKGATLDYIALMKRKEKDQIAREQQQMQAQQEVMMATEQARAQSSQATQAAMTDREMQKAQYKGNVDLQKTAMKEDSKRIADQSKQQMLPL